MNGKDNLANIARNRIKRRSLSTPIAGRKGYLEEGVHEVRVDDINLSGINEGYITVDFEGSSGSRHSQRLWIIDRYKDEYSDRLLYFINALFCDPTIYDTLDDLLMNQDIQESIFKTFKNLWLKIFVEWTEGYDISVDDNGNYLLIDAISKQLVEHKLFDSFSAAREYAVKKKYKKAWRQVKRFEALDDETLTANKQRFDTAVKGMLQATQSIGNLRQIFNPAAFASERQSGSD